MAPRRHLLENPNGLAHYMNENETKTSSKRGRQRGHEDKRKTARGVKQDATGTETSRPKKQRKTLTKSKHASISLGR